MSIIKDAIESGVKDGLFEEFSEYVSKEAARIGLMGKISWFTISTNVEDLAYVPGWVGVKMSVDFSFKYYGIEYSFKYYGIEYSLKEYGIEYSFNLDEKILEEITECLEDLKAIEVAEEGVSV